MARRRAGKIIFSYQSFPLVGAIIAYHRVNTEPENLSELGKEMKSAYQDPLQTIRHSLHDLAQPLAAITGIVDLLLLEMDKNDNRLQDIEMISQQLEKVIEIVQGLRRISREATEREEK
jgi:signal transduction histidine kinase